MRKRTLTFENAAPGPRVTEKSRLAAFPSKSGRWRPFALLVERKLAVAARGHAREGSLVAPTAHSSPPILHYIVQCIILHL